MTPALLELRRRLPASTLGWVWLATGLASAVAVLAQLRKVLWPLVAHPRAMGRHDWDQMEAHRQLVVKSLLRFHQFPSWNPYACGGHPAWGALEGDTVVVSPLLPLYLVLPLQIATHVEILVWAIVSAAGAWMLAARFTRSQAARGLVAVLFAVSGRWSLQIASGEAWFLAYALMPWALFFFDRAVGAEASLGPRRPRDVVWTGALLAMMLYAGGTYPLPQTAVVLGVYAVWLSAATRSAWPLSALGLSGGVACGLSAPKLVPILIELRRFHRPVDSPERAAVAAIEAAFSERTQSLHTSMEGVDGSAWHEYGIYVGGVGVALLAVGLLLASGRREQPLRALVLAFAVFSLGSFHEYAPWSLAHQLPLLSLMHMPARWLYPALLLGACVTAATIERLFARSGRGRAAFEIALAVVVAWMAGDIAEVARRPLLDDVHEAGPTTPDRATGFVTETRLPPELEYQPGEVVPPTLPAELANVGTIECDSFPGLANFAALGGMRDGRPTELGAHGRSDPGYRGEVFLVEGVGTATIAEWSPNAVVVRVEQARAGDHVVLNQNWDPGWSVSGATGGQYQHTVAAALPEGTTTVRFAYGSPGSWGGLLLAAATVGALGFLERRRRRRTRA